MEYLVWYVLSAISTALSLVYLVCISSASRLQTRPFKRPHSQLGVVVLRHVFCSQCMLVLPRDGGVDGRQMDETDG